MYAFFEKGRIRLFNNYVTTLFVMRANFTITLVLLFFTHLLFAQAEKLTANTDHVISHDFKMTESVHTFQLCGLDEGRDYNLHVYDDRYAPQCSYDIEMKYLSKDKMVFRANSDCMELLIKRSDCKTDKATYPHLAVIGIEKDPKMNWLILESESDKEYLVQDILFKNDCFDLIPGSIQTRGEVGVFSNGATNIGLEEGIVLSTGPLAQLTYAGNTETGAGGVIGQAGDTDLFALEQMTSPIPLGNQDASILEFDFVPASEFMSFEYVFASEEYCDYAPNDFNDIFAFFLSGPGIDGGNVFSRNAVNIAYLPDPNDPTGETLLFDEPVTINNINWYKNREYYVSNVHVPQGGSCSSEEVNAPAAAPTETQFDGWTVPLRTIYRVQPCETYHVKIAIADGRDQLFGSAILLKANSFSAGGEFNIDIAFDETGDNYMYEGCGDSTGVISFISQNFNPGSTDPVVIGVDIVNGPGASNRDYDITFNNAIVLPNLPINPDLGYAIHFEEIVVFSDSLIEGTETISIYLDLPCTCTAPSYTFDIIDIHPITISNVDDFIMCGVREHIITPTINGGFPDAFIGDGPPPDYSVLWEGPAGFISMDEQITFTPPPTPGVYPYYLTVTDNCNKIAYDTAYITVVGEPEASMSGIGFVCPESPTTDLPVNLSGPGPTWDIVYTINGVEQPPVSTDQSPYYITTDVLGIYEVISVETSGCDGTIDGTAIVGNPNFFLVPDPSMTSCNDGDDGIASITTLGGLPPYSYTWDDPDNQTTQDAIGLPPGAYNVTITDANGCTAASPEVVVEDPEILTAEVTLVTGTTCAEPEIGELTVTAEGGTGDYDYLWSNNTIFQNATDLPAGDYQVSVTDENGCTVLVGQTVPADVNAPDVVASVNDVLTCTTTSLTLSGDGSSTGTNISYAWSTTDGNILEDETTLTPLIDSIGSYQLLVTNMDNGCTSVDTVEVVNDLETPIADAGLTDTLNCTDTSLNLDAAASSGTTSLTYEWIDENNMAIADAATTTISTPGTYTLIVTHTGNGCTDEANIVIDQDVDQPLADAGLTAELTCAITELNLNADASSIGTEFIYNWTTPDGSIVADASSLTPQINAPGTYNLVVTNTINGCTNDADVVISQDITPPVVEAGLSEILNCTVESLVLDGTGTATGTNITYNWDTPNGNILQDEMTLSPEINAPGMYNLVVTNTDNGCTAMDMVEIGQDTDAPISDAGEPSSLNCNVVEINLDGTASSTGANISLEWSTTDGAFETGETTLSPTINVPGTYVLTLTNTDNNCTSVSSVTIPQDITDPIADAGSDFQLNCIEIDYEIGGTLTSTGSEFSYNWTSADGNVGVNANAPNLQINTPGTYHLLVTNTDNGCTHDAEVVISQDINLPMVEAGLTEILSCAVESLVLDGTGTSTGGNMIYNWDTPNGNILQDEMTLNPEINAPGMYNLLVTNTDNGCTAMDMVEIEQDTNAPISDAGEPATLDCNVLQLNLDGSASSSGANISFNWSTTDGSIETGETSLSPTVNAPGTYVLTLTNMDNNCTSVSSVTIPQDIENPIADVGTTFELNCTEINYEIGGPMTSSGSEFTYTWTTTDGNFNSPTNAALVTVDDPGIYELLVTNTGNGCTAMESILITENIINPVANAGAASTLTCVTTDVVLDGSASSTGTEFTYNWTTPDGNILADEMTLNPTIDDPGVYTLLVTNDLNNCTAEQSVTITEEVDFPTVMIEDPMELNCTLMDQNLDASASSEGMEFTYQWSTSDGNIVSGDDSTSPTIDAPGTYELLIANTSNGCNSMQSITVAQNITPPIADAGNLAVLDCATESIDLDGGASDIGANFAYEWTSTSGNILNGTTTLTPTVDQPAIYTLIVTNTNNNCTTTADVTIEADANAPVSDAGLTQELNCAITSLDLDGTNSSTGFGLTYTWTTTDGNILSGNDGLNPTIDQPGIYALSVFDPSNSCETTSSVTITQDITNPTVEAGTASQLNCTLTELNLDATGTDEGAEFNYVWTTIDGNILSGNDGLSPLIDAPGTYQLEVTNMNNNCVESDQIIVDEDITLPSASIEESELLTCTNISFNLDANNSSLGAEFIYAWTTTDGNIISGDDGLTPIVDAMGTYELLVTNTDNNCVSNTSVFVDQDVELPTVNIGTPSILTCEFTNAALSGVGSSENGNFAYEWSTIEGNIVSGATSIIQGLVDAPGTYYFTVTNNDNQCVSLDSVEVLQDIVSPIAMVEEATLITCDEPIITLDGSMSSTGSEYTYLWTGTGIFGTALMQEVQVNAAGNYDLLVTDISNGCTAMTSVLVDASQDVPLASIGTPEELNCTILTVDLEGNVNNATNVGYSWTTPDGNIIAGIGTSTITVDAPGNYTLDIVNEDNGCTTQAQMEVSQDIAIPEVDAGDTFELNCTIVDGNLNGSGATGNEFVYLWSTTDGSIVSGEDGFTPLVNAPGEYTLLISNNLNGCTDEASIIITQNENIPVDFTVDVTDPPCFGDPAALQVSTVDGGVGPYMYSIDNGASFTTESIFTNLEDNATYDIQIMDVNGCELSTSLFIPFVPEVTVDLESEVEIRIGDTEDLEAITNIPPDEIQSVSWTPSSGLSCDTCLTTTTNTLQNTLYTVTVVNENGCTDQAQIIVEVDREINVFVPNAFTPYNGDGVNDALTLFARDGSVANIHSFQVFDRWGSLVFSTKDILPNNESLGWNGLLNGEELEPGIYVYVFDVELLTGRREIVKGDVLLAR